MSIIQRKILNRNEDINIKFSLSSNDDQTGHQEEIDEFTQIQTSTSINEPTDAEVRRFSYSGPLTTFGFSFHNGSQYSNSFTYAGFTNDEINVQKSNFLNSFFRLDFYDTFIVNQQTRIFSSYLTRLLDNKLSDNTVSSYVISDDNEFYYLNIPISFYKNKQSIIDGYGLFTFYNAKESRTSIFYNQDNDSLTTPEKMYFKIRINVTNRTWEILTTSIQNPSLGAPRALAYELVTSTQYVERYNNTLDNFNNLNQNYPIGSTFDFETGKYTT